MKYFFWILGCAMNYSDAERLASVLDALGYQKTTKESEADFIFVVACSVRQSAINRIYGKAKDWRKLRIKNKELRIFLTGCVLEQDKKAMSKIFDAIIPIEDIPIIPEILGIQNSKTRPERKSNGFKAQYSGDYLNIIPSLESPFRAFVPISTGCNNFCSYCAVPYTRGREKSREKAEIIKEIKGLVTNGYKEITLLGQNVNSYGQDLVALKKGPSLFPQKGTDPFVDLLKAIDGIPGDFRVYFYSNHPKDMSRELIDVLPKLEHFPKYIHLPLQSGNDEIIRKMNRHYTKEKYLNLVTKIREAMPEVVLTTDVIVGFPGETEEQFKDTVEVMEKAEFDMAFLAQYSPRPGTAAEKLEDNVEKNEKKRREDVLQMILEKTAKKNNQKLVGQEVRVLFDEVKNNKFYGRTDGYKVVEIATDNQLPVTSKLIGQFGMVKITSATAWKLSGHLV